MTNGSDAAKPMKTAQQGLMRAYGRFPTMEEFRRLEAFSRVEVHGFGEPGAAHGAASGASPSDDNPIRMPVAVGTIKGRSK
jgi:hypothetical protein